MSPIRIALVAIAALSVAIAGYRGLERLGIVLPLGFGDAASSHGALMVTAIGLLIALERATVVRRRWAWAAPALAAASAVLIVVGAPANLDAAASLAAAVVLVVVAATGAAATPGIAIGLMSVGAVAWVASSVLRLVDADTAQVVPWWTAFLALTIAGERHELARALRPSRSAAIVFVSVAAVFCAGIVLTLLDLAAGIRVAGAGLLALGLWLVMRDRPLQASRANPLARFIGFATRLGYLWLLVSAFLMITFDGVPAGWRYDAMLHTFFSGFVLSLVVAHGPIVIPVIVGRAFTYRVALYAGPILISASLIARIAGDLLELASVRQTGAAGVGLGLALFGVTMVLSLRPQRAATRAAVVRRDGQG